MSERLLCAAGRRNVKHPEAFNEFRRCASAGRKCGLSSRGKRMQATSNLSNFCTSLRDLQFMLCSVNRSRVISVHILSLLRVTNQRYRDPVSSRRQPLLCCGAMAPKRKADQPETPDTEKKPRAKAAKKSPATEPYSTDDGWTVVPPSLLFKYAGHAGDEHCYSHTHGVTLS